MMDQVCIYLNKHVRSTLFVFLLMGITYLLLGVSDLLKDNLLMGIVEIALSSIALVFLLLNSLPAFEFKLFYCIDKDRISKRTHLFQKKRTFAWDTITEIRISNSELMLFLSNGKSERINLNSLNYNEKQYFTTVLLQYIDLYHINQI